MRLIYSEIFKIFLAKGCVDMTFEEKLEYYTHTVNSELERAAEKYLPEGLITSSAMKYSLLAGGKRIRPIIALAVCDAYGGDERRALVFGCALEMIHTYSLIHDDLPCMDNDTLRRGVPTCHVKFGEAYALLAGDGLLTLAFEYITKEISDKKAAFNFIAALSECAGISGMVGGQTDDVRAERERADISHLRSIHARKTGALINAAGAAGAIAAGKDRRAAEDFTKSLGLAFQIKDDILDVEGDEKTLGKSVMKDVESEKSTFVTLLGLERAEEELEKETEKAIRACERIEKGDFLKSLALWLLNRRN